MIERRVKDERRKHLRRKDDVAKHGDLVSCAGGHKLRRRSINCFAEQCFAGGECLDPCCPVKLRKDK